jgi:hypothetical protein
MTHNELLAKLTPTQERGFSSNPITVFNTLRAVVELHKPINTNILREEYIGCNACFGQSYEYKVYQTYPCPTIQAIEKAMK